MLTEHQRGDVGASYVEGVGKLASEPHRIGIRTGPDHTVTTDPCGELANSQFHRIGLHDHEWCRCASIGNRLGESNEQRIVGAREQVPVDGCSGVGGDGRSREYDQHVGIDVLGIKDQFDGRCMVGEGIAEVGSESVELRLARPAPMTDELEPGVTMHGMFVE